MKIPHAFGLVCALIVVSSFARVRASTLVVNPSFEANYNDAWPHYGAIDNWGGSGVNDASGPFHNGGTPIPDRDRVGFMQGSAQISQSITGLEAGKQYWIQFYYDARACCGGTVDLVTEWDDTGLDTISNVLPSEGGAGYKFKNVVMTPAGDGTLKFRTAATGDATILIDAVSIVQRDAGQVVVRNPSFEASDTPEAPGIVPALAGWTTTLGAVGAVGVNDATGPFADNGAIPDQDHVLFIQQEGSIEQVLSGLVAGQPYTVSFGYNARGGNVPHLRVSIDGAARFDQDVTAVGGAAAYRAGSFNFTPAGVAGTATTAVIAFAQTEAVADVTVLLDNIKISGQVIEPIPNLKVGPTQMELAVGMTGAVAVTVSGKRREQGASVVVIKVANPAIASLVDADVDGNVTLTFPAGAAGGPDLTLTTNVIGGSRGSTSVVVVDNGGHDGVDGSVLINVVQSFVRNPSFEANAPAAFPGYGPIASWASTGGSGVNNASGPFHDNGTIPDGGQIGFVQGTQTLSQPIVGLTPGKRYWLQFYYNARAAGGTAINLTTRFAGTALSTISDIDSSGGYRLHTVGFIPAAADGLLEFAAQTGVDATVLLDGVTIVQRDAGEVVVANPSFEASGIPTGVGYLSGRIAGWESAGGKGINLDTVGPFTDNGVAGEQDRVAFLQGTGSFSQIIEGLTPGASYTLIFSINARNCCTAGTDTPYAALIDGVPLIEEAIPAVGVGVPYLVKYLPFAATAATAELKFESRVPGGEDHSLLLDAVRIVPGVVGPGSDVTLSIAIVGGNSVELRWPADAPATIKLQTSATLLTNSWEDDLNPVSVIGDENVVIEPFNGPVRFFRLAQP